MRWLSIALLAAACGAPRAPIAALPTEGPGAARTLDWAMLLPIDTVGIMRVDLARVRRSPHRSAIQPRLGEILVAVEDPSIGAEFADLLDRTEVALVGMVPPADPSATSDDVLVFLRGDYREDEIDRLGLRTPAIELEGYRVRRAPSGGLAIVALRPDTLLVTASIEQLGRVLARTRMENAGVRWPPAIRPLVDAVDLEHSTFGVAIANGNLEDGAGEDALQMSLAGRADFDGPLDIEVLFELGDPAIAATAAMIFHAMLLEVARAAPGGAEGLRRLAQLARIEPSGSRVSGTVHADRATASALVPSLLALLTDGIDGPAPALSDPLRPAML
jgi:hypothetical protein